MLILLGYLGFVPGHGRLQQEYRGDRQGGFDSLPADWAGVEPGIILPPELPNNHLKAADIQARTGRPARISLRHA